MEDKYHSVERCRIWQLMNNLASPASACRFFFLYLDFFNFFMCEADLLSEIFLDELKSFPASFEEDVVKLRDRHDSTQRVDQIPWINWYHIDHLVEY